MKYKGRQRSRNVEDRRGGGTAKKAGGVSIIVIIVGIIYVLLGGNPQDVLQAVGDSNQGTTQQTDYKPTAQEEELAEFVSVTLKYTEDVWAKIFREQLGRTY